MGENAGNWEVFDEVNYNGHTVVLISGEEYANPGEMGIVHPVKRGSGRVFSGFGI